VAHSVPDVPVSTTFNDLDDAMDTVGRITEKYRQLFFSKRLRELEPLHHADKNDGLYVYVLQLSKNPSLLDEMKKRKLSSGWDEVSLDPGLRARILVFLTAKGGHHGKRPEFLSNFGSIQGFKKLITFFGLGTRDAAL